MITGLNTAFTLLLNTGLWLGYLFVPLLVLFFKIDKRKLFFMGFYGYSIHMLFGYIDLYNKNSGLLNDPFSIIPGLSLASSFLPVTYMLVYQWTLNHKKNYYGLYRADFCRLSLCI
jgi:hypothetical protein